MPEDEYTEYAAYLKQRSYDDLVSIRYNLNQETQARRYELVLAEIAGREKRGETSDENSDGKVDAKALSRAFSIVIGFIFAILGLVGVLTGTLYTKHGHQIIADKSPVAFRILVGLYFAMAAFGLFLGFKKRK